MTIIADTVLNSHDSYEILPIDFNEFLYRVSKALPREAIIQYFTQQTTLELLKTSAYEYYNHIHTVTDFQFNSTSVYVQVHKKKPNNRKRYYAL